MELLILSHGNLAEEACRTCGMILGDNPLISFVGLDVERGVEPFRQALAAKLSGIKGPYLVLCDVKSGTPFNTVAQLAHKDIAAGKCAVVCGFNLPILLELSVAVDTGGASNLADLCAMASEVGRHSICVYAPQDCRDMNDDLL